MKKIEQKQEPEQRQKVDFAQAVNGAVSTLEQIQRTCYGLKDVIVQLASVVQKQGQEIEELKKTK